MYWKPLFFISTLGWLSICLFSQCTHEGPSPAAGPMAPASEVFDTLQCGPGHKDPACARVPAQIASYTDFLDSLRGSIQPGVDPIEPGAPTVEALTQELLSLKGFRFDARELAWIAQQAQAQDSMVYVMLAVNDDPKSIAYRKSLDSPIRYLDLYFQVVTPEGTPIFFRPDSTLKLNDYADFPQPCPPYCP